MAADSGMEATSDTDVSDSRKRPLDGESENGSTKRSNFGGAGDGVYHLKILVPGTAAGGIIGKGGETIAQVQKETGAKLKMSKANDYYPGTSERVCLISGSVDAIMEVMDFINEKIREKPEKEFESKASSDREKQVKILIPNSTAGMIIGKGGNYIKQIKEESGAYVQISQKARDQSLHERCITVIGDYESNKKALLLILGKIVDDPQSGSQLNVSYADMAGPVANFNPTGSPYALGAGSQSQLHHGFGGGSLSSMGALLMNSGGGSGGGGGGGGGGAGGLNLSLNLSGPTGGSHSLTSQLLDHIKLTLRSSGYTDQATGEIIGAMTTLARYGILGMGLGLSGNNSSSHFLGFGGMDGGSHSLNGGGGFGPIGTMSGSPTRSGDKYDNINYDLFKRQSSPISINNNSFGLGTSQPALSPGSGGNDGKDSTQKKIEMEISENIVGAILGPGGRALVEIQHYSGASIQISKKGVFAPGTRNRIVTITGPSHCISTAQYLIEQRVTEEEAKRSRGGNSSSA